MLDCLDNLLYQAICLKLISGSSMVIYQGLQMNQEIPALDLLTLQLVPQNVPKHDQEKLQLPTLKKAMTSIHLLKFTTITNTHLVL